MQSKREANSLILYPSYISIPRILKGNRPRDYRYTISRILRVGTEDWDRMAERKQFSDDLEFGVTRNWNSALNSSIAHAHNSDFFLCLSYLRVCDCTNFYLSFNRMF